MTRRVSLDHRDPGLRPFIEVEAKITRGILAEGGSPRDVVVAIAEAATSDAELGAREMSEAVPATRRLLPVCQDGCAHCCHATVLASTPEILRIAEHLRTTRQGEAFERLRAHAGETAERVRALDLEARAAAKVPCPLLDPTTSRCTAYDVRPVACRAYHSGDVATCKRAFDDGDPNPVLPINPVLFHVAHAYSFGMMTACAAEELEVGPFDLAATLDVAIGGEDLEARWLAREQVLPHTPLSREVAEGFQSVLRELASDLDAGRLEAASRVAVRSDPDARRRERNRKKRERRGR